MLAEGKRVAVSLLSCDVLSLRREVEELVEMGVSYLHLDVMDGVFVNGIFLGEEAANRIVEEFRGVKVECHLMVSNPLNTIKNLKLDLIGCVIVHSTAKHLKEVGEYLTARGVELGIAISPEEEIKQVSLPDGVAKILLMGVKPGKGGQDMVRGIEDRIEEAKSLLAEKKIAARLGIDGGVSLKTAHLVKSADDFVLGSFLFKEPRERRKELLEAFFKEIE